MILLIDNYDSFTYNLLQYIGQFATVQVVKNDDPDLERYCQEAEALVLSPGPGWPRDAGKMEEMIAKFYQVKPILGICLGHQALAETFGGKLGLAKEVMHGKQAPILFEKESPIFKGVGEEELVMRYHSLAVEDLPDDFEVTARAKDGTIMALQHKELPIFGLQYHPESIGTPSGMATIKNFLDYIGVTR